MSIVGKIIHWEWKLITLLNQLVWLTLNFIVSESRGDKSLDHFFFVKSHDQKLIFSCIDYSIAPIVESELRPKELEWRNLF